MEYPFVHDVSILGRRMVNSNLWRILVLKFLMQIIVSLIICYIQETHESSIQFLFSLSTTLVPLLRTKFFKKWMRDKQNFNYFSFFLFYAHYLFMQDSKTSNIKIFFCLYCSILFVFKLSIKETKKNKQQPVVKQDNIFSMRVYFIRAELSNIEYLNCKKSTLVSYDVF